MYWGQRKNCSYTGKQYVLRTRKKLQLDREAVCTEDKEKLQLGREVVCTKDKEKTTVRPGSSMYWGQGKNYS